jgi:hypothetical protein
MPAQVAPIRGDRDQQYEDAQPDLHPTGQPWRIDRRDQVVRGLTGTVAQVILPEG